MRTPIWRRAFCALLLCAWICELPRQAACAPAAAGESVVIERAPVESSSLVSIGFARKAQILEIEFRSGAIYCYLGVPPAVFDELKKAESKGRYFAQSIRGKYEFRHIEKETK